jgi:hypothetical protein
VLKAWTLPLVTISRAWKQEHSGWANTIRKPNHQYAQGPKDGRYQQRKKEPRLLHVVTKGTSLAHHISVVIVRTNLVCHYFPRGLDARRETNSLGDQEMAGLDKSLLYKIMQRVGEIESNALNCAESTDFLEFIGKEGHQAELKDMLYIDKHLVFLEECGFLSLFAPTHNMKRGAKLTGMGHMFLQPELAEFVNASLLPDIIKAIEERIQTLTYPEEEKTGLLYRVREAIAKQSGDLIVKILVEIAFRYAQIPGS